MLNQFVLVGRLIDEVKTKKVDGKDVATIKLAVDRVFKNTEGIYETDIIPCVLWHGIATNVADYCGKGDIVGVKGRIEENEEKIVIIAEKVTFLSSKKDNKESEKN